MSKQKAGSNLDNHIATAINEATGPKVSAHSMRGSGNTGYAEVDVIVRTPLNDKAVESKRSSVGTGEYAYVLDADDTRQLSAVSNDYTTTWVLVKFTNREPALFRTPKGGVRVDRVPSAFEPHVDESAGYELRLTKPSADEWPSAQAGRSLEEVLVEGLSLEEWVVD
jgi:hypothetical protein